MGENIILLSVLDSIGLYRLTIWSTELNFQASQSNEDSWIGLQKKDNIIEQANTAN